jgi:hypothetical protein
MKSNVATHEKPQNLIAAWCCHHSRRTFTFSHDLLKIRMNRSFTDHAREVQTKAVIVPRHVGRFILEECSRPGHKWHISADVVPVFIPAGGQIFRREQCCQRSGLGRRPGHDNGIVTGKLTQIINVGGRLRQGRRGRCVRRSRTVLGSRPAGAENRRLKPSCFEPLLWKFRIIIQNMVVNVQIPGHVSPFRSLWHVKDPCRFAIMNYNRPVPQLSNNQTTIFSLEVIDGRQIIR